MKIKQMDGWMDKKQMKKQIDCWMDGWMWM